MSENKVIKRIPGAPPVSPKEKQGYIEDLGKLSKVQLVELLERQSSLLRNKAFIKRLPDKGEKISTFKCRLEAELDRRKEVENTVALLEKLNINCPVEEIEWTGKYSAKNHDVDEGTAKGEESETNVLQMLASHGGTSKIERVMKTPEELITKKDLEEINAIKDPYAKALCSKLEEINSRPMKEIFKPSRTLKNKGDTSPKQRPSSRSSQSDGQNLEEGEVDAAKGEVTVMKGDGEAGASSTNTARRVRHWEVTAATPLTPVHDKTVLLDLEVSIALEKAAVEKMLEARTKQSMSRLAEQLQRGSFTQYRNVKEISSDEDDDDEDDGDDGKKKEEPEECGDEDEEPERDVAVAFSVID